ncbi:MAG: hypothetical protein J6129_05340 [Bacteroidaceae bacterium]|nr:hypothetical protein [Bacteroidaceae bacterium]
MRLPFVLIILAATVGLSAQKHVYIPRDLRGIDLNDSTSKWNWRNSAQTEDLVFFWERPFGANPAKAPALEGKPMTFDLDNVVKRVQHFYEYFRDSLQFILPGGNADSLKMMVMINYSLEGTAYGGDYDGRIGALWVAPNRIQDRHLNCLAHELGHSFQRQITSDGTGEAWGGSGFFEMTSQWMLWRVNPNWPTEENYHLQAFRKATHKAFLSGENIYRSPYVIEYWAEKHGLPHIANLYREGKRGEDPAITYMRVNHLSQKDFCDELFDCYTRLLNFDFRHAYNETRRHACTFNTPLDTISAGHYRIPGNNKPEPYGFNAIKLTKTQQAKVKNICAPKGYKLRWTIVDEPNCRYLLVMNQPQKHPRMPHRGRAKADPLPTIGYDIIVTEK